MSEQSFGYGRHSNSTYLRRFHSNALRSLVANVSLRELLHRHPDAAILRHVLNRRLIWLLRKERLPVQLHMDKALHVSGLPRQKSGGGVRLLQIMAGDSEDSVVGNGDRKRFEPVRTGVNTGVSTGVTTCIQALRANRVPVTGAQCMEDAPLNIPVRVVFRSKATRPVQRECLSEQHGGLAFGSLPIEQRGELVVWQPELDLLRTLTDGQARAR